MNRAEIKSNIGAIVLFCGHDGCFVADILRMGPVTVVNAGRPISPATIVRDGHLGKPTHHIVDFPIAGFWQPNKGVFVVPSEQVKELL